MDVQCHICDDDACDYVKVDNVKVAVCPNCLWDATFGDGFESLTDDTVDYLQRKYRTKFDEEY